ncbi:MAG: hypothetical protein IJK67_04725 [Bacilli bacterium]|nr:hypothetical protein [Bacilli bacterium]
MISSIDEFKKKYPKSAIVNYDVAEVHGYGLCFKIRGTIEKFRKDKGKYITYPQIQPYSKLTTDYKLFIIKNNKMYELENGNIENTYHIKNEIVNINLNIFTDIFYISKSKHKEPKIIDEPIYTIYE